MFNNEHTRGADDPPFQGQVRQYEKLSQGVAAGPSGSSSSSPSSFAPILVFMLGRPRRFCMGCTLMICWAIRLDSILPNSRMSGASQGTHDSLKSAAWLFLRKDRVARLGMRLGKSFFARVRRKPSPSLISHVASQVSRSLIRPVLTKKVSPLLKWLRRPRHFGFV